MKKGQASLDFIGGFLVLILAVIIAANSALSDIPSYYNVLEENTLHQEAWLLSERLMGLLEAGPYALNRTVVLAGSSAQIGPKDPAYAELKRQLLIGREGEFQLEITEYPVLVTENASGVIQAVADIDKDGDAAVFGVNTIDYTVNGAGIGDAITADGSAYNVKSIDSEGRFFILRKRLVKLGVTFPDDAMVIEVNRFSTYQGNPAVVRFTYAGY